MGDHLFPSLNETYIQRECQTLKDKSFIIWKRQILNTKYSVTDLVPQVHKHTFLYKDSLCRQVWHERRDQPKKENEKQQNFGQCGATVLRLWPKWGKKPTSSAWEKLTIRTFSFQSHHARILIKCHGYGRAIFTRVRQLSCSSTSSQQLLTQLHHLSKKNPEKLLKVWFQRRKESRGLKLLFYAESLNTTAANGTVQ